MRVTRETNTRWRPDENGVRPLVQGVDLFAGSSAPSPAAADRPGSTGTGAQGRHDREIRPWQEEHRAQGGPTSRFPKRCAPWLSAVSHRPAKPSIASWGPPGARPRPWNKQPTKLIPEPRI